MSSEVPSRFRIAIGGVEGMNMHESFFKQFLWPEVQAKLQGKQTLVITNKVGCDVHAQRAAALLLQETKVPIHVEVWDLPVNKGGMSRSLVECDCFIYRACDPFTTLPFESMEDLQSSLAQYVGPTTPDHLVNVVDQLYGFATQAMRTSLHAKIPSKQHATVDLVLTLLQEQCRPERDDRELALLHAWRYDAEFHDTLSDVITRYQRSVQQTNQALERSARGRLPIS